MEQPKPREFLIVYSDNLMKKSLDLVELTKKPFRIGFPGYDNDLSWTTEFGGRELGKSARYKRVTQLPKLSRDHCMITLEDGVRYIHDLGSRTGTYLNRERISKEREEGKKELKAGDVIGLIPHEDDFLLMLKYIIK